MYRKRLTRKQADKYDPDLFADEREQAPRPVVREMTVNGKGQYRLEDVLADSSNGERKQIMRYMGVKAVNGTKLHYKQNVPAKSAVNEEVENESGDENDH